MVKAAESNTSTRRATVTRERDPIRCSAAATRFEENHCTGHLPQLALPTPAAISVGEASFRSEARVNIDPTLTDGSVTIFTEHTDHQAGVSQPRP